MVSQRPGMSSADLDMINTTSKSSFTKTCAKQVCCRHNTMRGNAAQRATEGP